jgi:hypothetical protein
LGHLNRGGLSRLWVGAVPGSSLFRQVVFSVNVQSMRLLSDWETTIEWLHSVCNLWINENLTIIITGSLVEKKKNLPVPTIDINISRGSIANPVLSHKELQETFNTAIMNLLNNNSVDKGLTG